MKTNLYYSSFVNTVLIMTNFKFKNNNSKGQLAIEYLVITGFLLIVVGILSAVSLVSFNENTNLVKADSCVTKITNQANWVASLGNGSKVFFEIDVPYGVKSFNLVGKSANLVLSTSFGDNQIYDYARINLTPLALITTQGKKNLSATFLDGNVVINEES